MTNTYHATPYDISATGFYFSSYDDYLAKAADHRNAYGQIVEEFEIQFIDGDAFALFDALEVTQATLSAWFDQFEGLDGDEARKAIYLASHEGCAMDQILEQLEDVYLFEGTATEYAESYIKETGLLDQIPENLRFYFDVEAFARDLQLGDDIAVIEIDERSFVVQR
ncbi:antirestriction protein ArdA [Nisaea sediminum]|uniref:antirestriction protein ArdA n=1 Tax=Nisaea sediminum TaxID=2775867 RepID=UPI001868908C|nr:antirestriction protein ArdA [Nisaea sediminum]